MHGLTLFFGREEVNLDISGSGDLEPREFAVTL